MATKGKSLVGFMDQDAGVQYLRKVCALGADQSNARLQYEWKTANSKIGTQPLNRSGFPEIKPIPPEHLPYIECLKAESWLKPELEKSLSGAVFKVIEIDPLLAMQFAVDTDRSNSLTKSISDKSTFEDLLRICLPAKRNSEDKVDFLDARLPNSTVILSRNLSLKIDKEGPIDVETVDGINLFIGIKLVFPVPLVHVVSYEGRCYLHNGFHRAYGVRMAGHTHIPCIFREVSRPEDIGISKGETFDLDVLRSANPPTVAHFTQDKAHDVELKELTKMLQVTWSEYMMDGN